MHGSTSVTNAIRRRHRELADALTALDRDRLRAPSLLPDWARLTIVCHLRYGAEASARMTEDTVAGRPTAFYPGGPRERPETLMPRSGESAGAVVESLIHASTDLDQLWSHLSPEQWQAPVEGDTLGSITLATLALLRLTEVEVHGSDLDLGLSPWSETFVATALPFRLRWLETRRSNRPGADTTIRASWRFVGDGGTVFTVTVDGTDVVVTEADPVPTDVTVSGPERDLLAFILGRLPVDSLRVDGDLELARRFSDAFPPP